MNARILSQPSIRKGRRRNVDVCVVAWMDLLGYGNQIAQAGLNPISPEAVSATQRLESFSSVVKKHSHRFFPSLVVNDAAAFYRNLSFRTRANTIDFVNRAVRAHYAVKNRDNIGARTIVSVGFKAKHDGGRSDELREKANRFAAKVRKNRKSIEQAILDALNINSDFNQIPTLNSNYAFTKSYIVDGLGSAHGFQGAGIFIEKGIFNVAGLPDKFVAGSVKCVIFGREYEYLICRRVKLAERHFVDTIEVAKYLAGDECVFDKIFV